MKQRIASWLFAVSIMTAIAALYVALTPDHKKEKEKP